MALPEYNKKKHGFSFSNRKKKKDFYYDDNYNQDDVKPKLIRRVKNTKNYDNTEAPRVINGKKKLKQVKYKIILFICAILILTYLILMMMFPVGVTEAVYNFFGTLGGGDYPIEICGSKTLDAVPSGNYYYLLTDLNLYKITNSGKVIDSYTHGFAKPVLKSSDTRSVIYDQGQKSYIVSTINKTVVMGKTDYGILCADISDSGVYAVATLSDAYSSCFSVYDKSGKSIFKWNCAKDMINSVCVSANGKTVAVSTINAVNGELNSKLYIFDVKNTNPEKTYEYNLKTVYSLESASKGFYAVTDSGYDYIDWSELNKSENPSDLKIDFFKSYTSGSVVVLNRTNNSSDNIIRALSNDGKVLCEFNFNGNISDIRIKKAHIYFISEGKVYIYDTNGKFVSSVKCDFDYRFIIPSSAHKANIISDNFIDDCKVD